MAKIDRNKKVIQYPRTIVDFSPMITQFTENNKKILEYLYDRKY
jgi:hypothetical protein